MKTMKALTWVAALILVLGALAPAQDEVKPPPPPGNATEKQPELVPLRIDVVFSEYEGSKKISSLPNTILVNANERKQGTTRLRMGLRVPIATGSLITGGTTAAANTQYQYEDVGTDIDCTADTAEGGKFSVYLSVNRSSLYNPQEKDKAGDVPLSVHPIFSHFSSNFRMLMRDGETVQSTMATDPVSGRVLKVDVTLRVVK
jgi:hypothetical protein